MTRFQNALAMTLLFWIIDYLLRWVIKSPIPLIIELEVSILVGCIAWMFFVGKNIFSTALQRGIASGIFTILFQILSLRGATSAVAVGRAFVIVTVIVIISSLITTLPFFQSSSHNA